MLRAQLLGWRNRRYQEGVLSSEDAQLPLPGGMAEDEDHVSTHRYVRVMFIRKPISRRPSPHLLWQTDLRGFLLLGLTPQ